MLPSGASEKREEPNNFSPASCQRVISTVFLAGSRLWRVRLVVRTQPSQGWYTGSTPVRAAMVEHSLQSVSQQIRNKHGMAPNTAAITIT